MNLFKGTLFTPKLIYFRYFLCIPHNWHLCHEEESYFSIKKKYIFCYRCQTVGFFGHWKAEVSHSPGTIEQMQLKFASTPCHTDGMFFSIKISRCFGNKILFILRIYRINLWIGQMAKLCLYSFWSKTSSGSSKAFRLVFLFTL